MPFIPAFMVRFDEYSREKKSIRTIDDWRRFNLKWFVRQDWPKREQGPDRTFSSEHPNVLHAGGRVWCWVFYSFDIGPEARYEFMFTSSTIGLPLALPNGIHRPKQRGKTYGWNQECPFDEITTDEIGDETCPLCGREMIYTWTGD